MMPDLRTASSHHLGQGNIFWSFDVLETTSFTGKICPVCGKQFSGRNRRQNLEHHLITHTGERRHPCPLCPHRAAHKWHLKTHILRRHANHPSLSQVVSSLRQGEPVQHESDYSDQSHVEGDVSFDDAIFCEVCGKIFQGRSRKWKLNRHMFLHTGEKPFQCPYCSHRANQRNNLRIHIRSKHEVWSTVPVVTQPHK
ncbi:hypothetical protein SK128_021003 [Halocaridina rubra]|uniref:C2H2-type domain-containing protein n=1 Tax=Halocaridina rubra TaxID=373956 RepID=A0AAN8ZSF2_HALRR